MRKCLQDDNDLNNWLEFQFIASGLPDRVALKYSSRFIGRKNETRTTFVLLKRQLIRYTRNQRRQLKTGRKLVAYSSSIEGMSTCYWNQNTILRSLSLSKVCSIHVSLLLLKYDDTHYINCPAITCPAQFSPLLLNKRSKRENKTSPKMMKIAVSHWVTFVKVNNN